MFQGSAMPWRAKSPRQKYYSAKPFSYCGPSEPTLGLRRICTISFSLPEARGSSRAAFGTRLFWD